MSLEMPIVSVIIPTYNAAHFILDTIKSVASQTMADFEVIVVDDSSSDDTLRIIRDFAGLDRRIRCIPFEKRSGVSAARNAGIKESRGKYIAFLDHDDLWLPQKLEKQIELFNRDSDLGLVFSKEAIMTLDNKTVGISGGTGSARKGYIFKDLLCGYSISPSTVVIKREVFDTLDEWFPESMEMAEEADLFLRAAYVYKIDYCNEVLVKWRMHSGNDSSLRRSLLIKDLNSTLDRLKDKIPDFEKNYKKEIQRKRRLIAMDEIEILMSENNRKLAMNKISIFFRIHGLYPKALIKFFILFILGFDKYDKIRLVFFNLYHKILNCNMN